MGGGVPVASGRLEVGGDHAYTTLVELLMMLMLKLTSHGFRDVLEIELQIRPDLYGCTAGRPPPLVSRQRPKERTLIGPAEAPLTRASSSRNGGRNHSGTPSEIKSECWARS